MIRIEKVSVYGFEEAIRGMRNPMNSWDRSDSYKTVIEDPETLETAKYEYFVGDNDRTLMTTLAKLGGPHAKFRRMIVVYMDITAPLYWWKQFDTYKVGTVSDSCSTMHKLTDRDLTMEDFSFEHVQHKRRARELVKHLNVLRRQYLDTKDKDIWDELIQTLPSSYNQKRTVLLNYEVLANIYKYRHDHKLGEWHTFCDWIRSMPYANDILITEEKKNGQRKESK